MADSRRNVIEALTDEAPYPLIGGQQFAMEQKRAIPMPSWVEAEQMAGGNVGARGGGGLSVRAVPSTTLRQGADPRATEVHLIDKNGVPHYRGEMTNEGNGMFGVGYVENLRQGSSGQGLDLYKAMAEHARASGGRLIGGMNTNRFSDAVHQQLIEKGLATPFQYGDRTLLDIHF